MAKLRAQTLEADTLVQKSLKYLMAQFFFIGNTGLLKFLYVKKRELIYMEITLAVRAQ